MECHSKSEYPLIKTRWWLNGDLSLLYFNCTVVKDLTKTCVFCRRSETSGPDVRDGSLVARSIVSVERGHEEWRGGSLKTTPSISEIVGGRVRRPSSVNVTDLPVRSTTTGTYDRRQRTNELMSKKGTVERKDQLRTTHDEAENRLLSSFLVYFDLYFDP